MQNKLWVLLFLFSACTNVGQKTYTYPPSNPYPKVFESIKDEDTGELLKADIKTETIEFECTERNDQPYYWCGIDGVLRKQFDGLPPRLETIFHVQLPIQGQNNTKKLLKKIKKRSKYLTMIIHFNPKIDEERNAFWNQLFLFYDKKSCVAFLGTENHCPKGTHIENIYRD